MYQHLRWAEQAVATDPIGRQSPADGGDGAIGATMNGASSKDTVGLARQRSRIGKYEIRRLLASGGFASVYEGWDPLIRRRVAIKVCDSPSREMRLRFSREAEIVGNLDHPNIVKVFDFGGEGAKPYLVQEFLSGKDLGERIEGREPLAFPEKLLIMLQLARGLEYAHGRGIVHRDIKPANVRLLEDGTAKIMDFGIATYREASVALTQDGTTIGTAAYLAPEQVHGHALDHRCDIFSYGVLAYELLAGRRPFAGETISAVLFQIVNQEPAPLPILCPDAPPALLALIERCLVKDPERRWSSMSEVRRRLEEIRDRSRAGRGARPTAAADVRIGPGPSTATPVDLEEVTLAGVGTEFPVSESRPSPWRRVVVIGAALAAVAALALAFGHWRGEIELDRLVTELRREDPQGPAEPRTSPPPATALPAETTFGTTTAEATPADSSATAPTELVAEHAEMNAPESDPAPPAASQPAPPPPAKVPNRSESETSQPAKPSASARDAEVLDSRLFLRGVWTPRITVAVDGGPRRPAADGQISIPPGRHSLVFALETPRFSSRRTVTVDLRAGERRNLDCPLPVPGLLTVQASLGARQADVLLDGKPVGGSPLRRLPLEPGQYELRIRARDTARPATTSALVAVESRSEMIVTFDLGRADPVTLRQRPLPRAPDLGDAR
jgi:serine/threonine-protein kinase